MKILTVYLIMANLLVLNTAFYSSTCPHVMRIIYSFVSKAVQAEANMRASLKQLIYIHGCDALVLLNETEQFRSEKSALPNVDSLKGFKVIDAIKYYLEILCPGAAAIIYKIYYILHTHNYIYIYI
ncbi:putative peroxidase [Rosa chinensis]|uniref:peroxidase n=1 Tax=Rosa chinensis TaxID=74649 RepID=A0A2P6RCY9_ROSCH|nr:putative peroxidase [Rosa chinensis]